jgi:hypothetical protein
VVDESSALLGSADTESMVANESVAIEAVGVASCQHEIAASNLCVAYRFAQIIDATATYQQSPGAPPAGAALCRQRCAACQVTPKDNFLVNCWHKPTGNCPSEPGPDVDFGSSPILRTLPNGKQVILAGQTSGVVYALDPDQQGKVLWQVKVGESGALGGVEWGHAADDQNVYAAISDVVPIGKRRPGLTR